MGQNITRTLFIFIPKCIFKNTIDIFNPMGIFIPVCCE